MFDKSKGLTTSEASRVKNFIKEMVKSINIDVNLPISSSTAVRDGEKLPLDTNVKVDDWKDLLLKKARLYSLSTWLGEAISIKDNKISKLKFEQFTGDVEGLKELPEQPNPESTNWENFFSTLNVAQQSEYLSNESLATHIGKFVHNFDDIREKLANFKPTDFKRLSDTETLTVTNELLYTPEELIEGAEELQGIHREANKVVNYWKAKHKEWKADKEREYSTALSQYNSDYSATIQFNQALRNKAFAEFNKEQVSKIEEASALKIVVPSSMQDILNEVYEKYKG